MREKYKMSELDSITKKEFDSLFKEAIVATEEQIHELSKNYVNMLQFRAQYRDDYKTNRIIHLFDGNTIQYELGTKRNIGFKYKNKTKWKIA